MIHKRLIAAGDELSDALSGLSWSEPVGASYNPLSYAREPNAGYIKKYAGRGQTLLLGMNPGPWGMAQTGVPFGTVAVVRDWLGINGHVGQPARPHPARPVTGFDCTRSEVSGSRLWGWARARWKTPDAFFKRFFVINYCPLIFFTREGRNITPDRLKASDRRELFARCDRALASAVEALTPVMVVGVGRFAFLRATEVLSGTGVAVGRITHPSPANPAANRGWVEIVERELSDMGVDL